MALNWGIAHLLLYTILLIELHNSHQLDAEASLTPSDSQAIREASRVNALPGQPAVAFAQYSGYITVEEKQHGRALFYWLFEAASSPESKPLVLWLNGGPGCSSIGYGATQELGPFRVTADGTALRLNRNAWNREANMLFLDSPVGVGFSYSNDSSDINNYGDKLTAEETYVFLRNWFEVFPDYKSRDFYVAGESYAGHYVPQLVNLVIDRNNDSSKYPFINIKGFMVGNALTDDYHDWMGIIDYAWSHAVISDDLYASVKNICNFQLLNWTTACGDEVSKVFVEYHKINVYNLYVPICLANTSNSGKVQRPLKLQKAAFGRPLLLAGYDPCIEQHTITYFNRPDVQRAIHANVTGIPHSWTVCNDALLNTWKDSQFSILPIYKKLIQAGLRIWVYSGDVDGRVPVTATRYSLGALGLAIKRPWSSWYHEHQVGGWTQEYDGLTFVTIRGAGHLVPQNSPSQALSLFASFLASKPLPIS